MDANITSIPWPFSRPLAKKWSQDLSNDTIPGDRPFTEELRTFNSASEGIILFLEAYGEDLSFDRQAIIRFCQDVQIQNICQQSKRGSAWMDDRTYLSYYPGSALPLVAVSSVATALPGSEISSVNQEVSRALYVEYASHTLDSVIPPGTTRILETGGRSAPNPYIPASRRYPAPLTAELLYENLKKKVN